MGLLAMAAYVVSAALAQRLAPDRLRLTIALCWAVHGVALALGLATDPMRFGFAPALSATLWLVLAVFLTEPEAMQDSALWRWLALLGAAALLVALWFPGSALPALRSAWLPLHSSMTSK